MCLKDKPIIIIDIFKNLIVYLQVIKTKNFSKGPILILLYFLLALYT